MGLFNKKKKSRPAKFVPDAAHTKDLIKVGKITAERSIDETKALGLPITYLKDGKVVREFPDGRIEIIGEI